MAIPKNRLAVSTDVLDAVDWGLLALLRSNARLTNAALAASVGIAASTCLERVRSLVSRGVIRRFTVDIDPAALGLGVQALISVNIHSGARSQITPFAARIRELPEVMQFFFVGGNEDFLVHVAVRDTDGLRSFVLDNLSADPVVAATRTSIIFDHVAPSL
jgi:DNA-binding Lrp family transcriptional regulator